MAWNFIVRRTAHWCSTSTFLNVFKEKLYSPVAVPFFFCIHTFMTSAELQFRFSHVTQSWEWANSWVWLLFYSCLKLSWKKTNIITNWQQTWHHQMFGLWYININNWLTERLSGWLLTNWTIVLQYTLCQWFPSNTVVRQCKEDS